MKLQARPSVWRPLAVLSEGVCDRDSQERVQSFHHMLEEDLTQKGLCLLTKASSQQEPWVNWEQSPLILTVNESLMAFPPWIKPPSLPSAFPPPSTYSHPLGLQELQVHLLQEVLPKPPTRACTLVPSISNDPGATLHDTHYSSNHGYLHSHTHKVCKLLEGRN